MRFGLSETMNIAAAPAWASCLAIMTRDPAYAEETPLLNRSTMTAAPRTCSRVGTWFSLGAPKSANGTSMGPAVPGTHP